MSAALIVASAVLAAAWRRCFGGWHPFGFSMPKIGWLAVYAVPAGLLAASAFPWTWAGLAAGTFATAAVTWSWTPAHGTDSNAFAGLKNDWLEQALRYGLMPGLLTALPFAAIHLWLSAGIMLASGILAGIAAAIFLTFGDRWKWLPVDPRPHSFADGPLVYNEFALGAIISGGYAAACLTA